VSNRLAAAAAAALGLFLVAGAAAAAIQHAPQPAIVFGALGLAHLAVAVGNPSRSRLAAWLGILIGVITIGLVSVGLIFIAGVEAGIGIDLNVAWFAPLNGYATIAVAIAILAGSAAIVVGGIRGVARRSASV
jgi:hypothetical protein